MNTKDDSKHASCCQPHGYSIIMEKGFTSHTALRIRAIVSGSERRLSQQVVSRTVPLDPYSELGLAVLHSKTEF